MPEEEEDESDKNMKKALDHDKKIIDPDFFQIFPEVSRARIFLFESEYNIKLSREFDIKLDDREDKIAAEIKMNEGDLRNLKERIEEFLKDMEKKRRDLANDSNDKNNNEEDLEKDITNIYR